MRAREMVLDPFGMGPRAPALGGALRETLRWAAAHSGLPMILVAAVGLVFGVRLAQRTVRFALEVAVALAVLAAATRAGWIHW